MLISFFQFGLVHYAHHSAPVVNQILYVALAARDSSYLIQAALKTALKSTSQIVFHFAANLVHLLVSHALLIRIVYLVVITSSIMGLVYH